VADDLMVRFNFLVWKCTSSITCQKAVVLRRGRKEGRKESERQNWLPCPTPQTRFSILGELHVASLLLVHNSDQKGQLNLCLVLLALNLIFKVINFISIALRNKSTNHKY
jgi:hypothetical protein